MHYGTFVLLYCTNHSESKFRHSMIALWKVCTVVVHLYNNNKILRPKPSVVHCAIQYIWLHVLHHVRERPLFCALFIIWTKFGFKWVGGLRTGGCSNWRKGKKAHTLKKGGILAKPRGGIIERWEFDLWSFQGVRIHLSSMFELDGGWVGQNQSESCSNWKKRTKYWTLPNPDMD